MMQKTDLRLILVSSHLSHFLLTAEFYPLLEAEAETCGDARIVNHSSLGRLHTPNTGLEEKYFGPNGGNLGGDEMKMMDGGCFHRYFQRKLANSVFTYGLHEKFQSKHSKVRAISPVRPPHAIWWPDGTSDEVFGSLYDSNSRRWYDGSFEGNDAPGC